MRNIFLTVVVIGALAVAGIGGTLAQWNEADHGTYDWDAGYLNLVIDIGGIGGIVIDDDDVGDLINEDQLMPGDSGEETFSFHVYGDPNEPSYATLNVTGTFVSNENGQVEPEITAGDTTSGTTEGELEDYLYITLWWDDGDNVWEEGEEVIFEEGTFADLMTSGIFPLEWDANISTTYYIGVAWHVATYAEEPTVNQAMTDEITGTVIFTVEGPFPLP